MGVCLGNECHNVAPLAKCRVKPILKGTDENVISKFQKGSFSENERFSGRRREWAGEGHAGTIHELHVYKDGGLEQAGGSRLHPPLKVDMFHNAQVVHLI